jgi:hypothetical protein
MLDDADPLGGWFLREVLQTDAGRAVNDIYGKLFVHVRSVLISFIQRLRSTGTNFEVYNLNAINLPKVLGPTKFARIDVCDTPRGSNVARLTKFF